MESPRSRYQGEHVVSINQGERVVSLKLATWVGPRSGIWSPQNIPTSM